MAAFFQHTVPFEAFGTSHLAVLTSTLILSGILVLGARQRVDLFSSLPPRLLLGLTIFIGELFFIILPVLQGNWNPRWALPLQICDVIALLCLPALVTLKPFLVEIVYFWAFTGTLFATISPELRFDFPNPEFFCSFASHSLVVAAASYLFFGLGIKPRRASAIRVFLGIHIYGVLIGVINWNLGANYLFLCHKPSVASPFDYLRDWTIYVIAVDTILFVLMGAIFLPFRSTESQSRLN